MLLRLDETTPARSEVNLQPVFLGELHERSFQAGSELWLSDHHSCMRKIKVNQLIIFKSQFIFCEWLERFADQISWRTCHKDTKTPRNTKNMVILSAFLPWWQRLNSFENRYRESSE